MDKQKMVIYQLLPRLFGNKNTQLQLDGSRADNGCGKFNDITTKALEGIKQLSATHVWYTGVIEHALLQGYPKAGIKDGNPLVIKGRAGSPYAVKDYYDLNPDLAENVEERMLEFQKLVKRTHLAGLKVIIDFVPNHLAREYHSDSKPEGLDDFGAKDDVNSAFSPTNNYYYLPGDTLRLADEIKRRFPDAAYEEENVRATGNDRFTAHVGVDDWYETVKLNYGVDYLNGKVKHFSPMPDTWLKMRSVLMYWVDQGVDGFRCDMVEMVPVEFWEWVIPQVKEKHPELVFIAEVYNPALYKVYIHQGKFDFLYDKVGLYDTLRDVICEKQSARAITQCWQKLEGIDQYMLRFLENHDEQRIASALFATNPMRAIPAMAVSAYLHQGPVMLYNGQEVGEDACGASGYSGDDGRTSIFDYWAMPQHQQWMNDGAFDGLLLSESQKQLRQAYVELLQNCEQPAIRSGLFYDLMWANEDNSMFDSNMVYAFLRYSAVQQLLVVCNFDANSQDVNVVLPPDALNVLHVPRPLRMIFCNLQTQVEKTIGTEELVSEGLSIPIQAFGYVVMAIEY